MGTTDRSMRRRRASSIAMALGIGVPGAAALVASTPAPVAADEPPADCTATTPRRPPSFADNFHNLVYGVEDCEELVNNVCFQYAPFGEETQWTTLEGSCFKTFGAENRIADCVDDGNTYFYRSLGTGPNGFKVVSEPGNPWLRILDGDKDVCNPQF